MTGERTESGVKFFWEEQARKHGIDPSATLADPYWRKLEIRVMLAYLKKLRPKAALDVGCGNGFSTVYFARNLPQVKFVGVDYSEQMIAAARSYTLPNCSFHVADVLKYESFPAGDFQIIFTQRCIQNILSHEQQSIAIRNLIRKKGDAGVLLLMECSEDGLPGFNAVSRFVQKTRELKKPPFHNLWFRDERMRREFKAEVKCFCSTYMLAKALDGRLRRLGSVLPQVGRFGYEKLYIIR